MTALAPTAPIPHLRSVDADLEEIDFQDFCRTIFASMSRSDQRRCAEVYVRGLLGGQGRRSSQRIAAEVAGPHNGQSLQQFVNQSPWDPQPVRSRLAELLTSLAEPTAWALDEVVFLKNGRYSPAVERQYVSALGRVANCQLGATMTFTTADVSVPVNWRLRLPESWDEDDNRRSRARIPASVRHRPYWQHLLDLVDDLTVDWGLRTAPVLADVTNCVDPERLFSGLEARDLDYLVRVDGRCKLRSSLVRGVPTPRGPVAELGRIVRIAERVVRRQTVVWADAVRGRELRSQFFLLPVGPAADGRLVRHVLVEWPFGRNRPRAMWLTNLTDAGAPELAALGRLRDRCRSGLDDLAGSYGLHHYEGRSYLGWHHHVTLVSAAYLFDLRHRLAAGR